MRKRDPGSGSLVLTVECPPGLTCGDPTCARSRRLRGHGGHQARPRPSPPWVFCPVSVRHAGKVPPQHRLLPGDRLRGRPHAQGGPAAGGASYADGAVPERPGAHSARARGRGAAASAQDLLQHGASAAAGAGRPAPTALCAALWHRGAGLHPEHGPGPPRPGAASPRGGGRLFLPQPGGPAGRAVPDAPEWCLPLHQRGTHSAACG